jgi:signal transduction histidine kinase
MQQTLEIDFKAVFENLPGENILLFPDPPFFTVAGISNDYCNAASISRNTAVGKSIIELVNQGSSCESFSSKDLFDSIEYALVNNKPHHLRTEAMGKQVSISHIPVRAASGEVLYIIHNQSCGQASESLSVSQGINGHSSQQSLDGVPLTDLIKQAPVAMGILKGKELIIETVNSHLLDVWGKTEEIIGLPIMKALSGDVDEPLAALLKNVYETGIVCHVFEKEATLLHEGNPVQAYFDFMYAPFKNKYGTTEGIMIVASDVTSLVNRLTGSELDITQRKHVEETLEDRVSLRTSELLNANRELERSNRELEQYAYVASHDLQEPLRKILVYTDLLAHSKEYNQSEQVKLAKIMSSAQRMSLLIKDLLNFSRLLKSENLFSVVDLNQILRNVADDFELRIQETNASVTIETLPVIEASPQQMNQLFYNLINNALKFRREGVLPKIDVKASVLTKREVKDRPDLNSRLHYVDIRVADNGIGINPKYLKQIFEIFKRLHSQSTFEGTGIGLALCRKIALNHHGDIYAESREGEGTVFHVLLPLKQKPGL